MINSASTQIILVSGDSEVGDQKAGMMGLPCCFDGVFPLWEGLAVTRGTERVSLSNILPGCVDLCCFSPPDNWWFVTSLTRSCSQRYYIADKVEAI